MKKCETCHAELKEIAKFCTNCGTPVGENIVETIDQEDIVETTEASQNEKTLEEMVDFDSIQGHFFDYVNFVKNSLIAPTRAMDDRNISWIHGLVSVILYVLLTTWFIGGEFFANFIKGLVFQAAFIGLLFVLNKFLFKNDENYFTTTYKYGTLVTTQVLIFLLINIFINVENLTVILLGIAVLNHINIFNTYIFYQQEKQPQKMDRYYQLVLSYLAFLAIAFLNPF